MKYVVSLVLTFVSLCFISCGGGGGGGGGSSTNYTYVKLLDGYIKNATLKDEDSTPVRYISDVNDTHYNQYRFYDTPKGSISASGGYFVGSDLANKMSFEVPSDTTIISPVVTFINSHEDIITDISTALGVSEGELRGDYIENANIKIARFAQMVYALNIHGLSDRFASYLDGVQNYSDIVLAGVRASEGTTYEDKIQSFITFLTNFTSVSSLEEDIYNQKKIMQEDVTSSSSGSMDGTSTPVYSGGLEVQSVALVGNLALNILFSEALETLGENKSAITLSKIFHSKVSFDSNSTAVVNGKTLTLSLANAIATEESSNAYIVGVSKSLVSSEGLILDNNTSSITSAPTALALQDVEYIDSKNIQATFNLPIDVSTINQNDFLVKVSSSGIEPSSISVDSSNSNVLQITLGNVLTQNLGYDLIIQNTNLASTTGLKMSETATKEFTAKVSTSSDLNEGFNLISASVNSDQTKLTLNFSKTIMSNPTPDMVSLSLQTTQDPIDTNITQSSTNSNLVNVKVSNTSDKLLSLEQNATYKLSVAKQEIFSQDGSRTLGTTYTQDIEVTEYPKVTNVTVNTSSLNITFNMAMEDINSTSITVEQGESGSLASVNTTLSGSGTNFIVSESNNTAFTGPIVRISISDDIYTADQNYILESAYVEDFNISK